MYRPYPGLSQESAHRVPRPRGRRWPGRGGRGAVSRAGGRIDCGRRLRVAMSTPSRDVDSESRCAPVPGASGGLLGTAAMGHRAASERRRAEDSDSSSQPGHEGPGGQDGAGGWRVIRSLAWWRSGLEGVGRLRRRGGAFECAQLGGHRLRTGCSLSARTAGDPSHGGAGRASHPIALSKEIRRQCALRKQTIEWDYYHVSKIVCGRTRIASVSPDASKVAAACAGHGRAYAATP